MNALFDPVTLSDQELDQKLEDINKKIIIVNHSPGNVMLINQMKSIRDSIYLEMQERMLKEEAQKNRGTVLESGGYEKEKRNG